jgi:hypothetical protein
LGILDAMSWPMDLFLIGGVNDSAFRVLPRWLWFQDDLALRVVSKVGVATFRVYMWPVRVQNPRIGTKRGDSLP